MALNLVVPLSFISSNLDPSWREVRFGIDKGVFTPSEAIGLAIERLGKGDNRNLVVDLACQGPNDSVRTLVEQLAEVEVLVEKTELCRTWAFLVFAWVFEHRSDFEDPLGLAELVYAEFDYPEEAAAFIRYMPAQEPDLGSVERNEARLLANWESYVQRERDRFAKRSCLTST